MKTRAVLFFIMTALILYFSAQASAQSADQEVVSVVDSPDPVTPGNDLTYTITVRNNGPNSATNGGFNASLDGNLTYISTVAPAGFTCSAFGSSVSCTNPSFAPGTVVFTMTVKLAQHLQAFPDGTVSSNFSPSGTTPDPNNGNNGKSVTTAYDSPQVDVSVTATDSPDPVFPDGNITYTVNVTNGGPDSALNARLNVPLNNTLRFQSITIPAGWSCPSLPSVGGGTSFTCTNPSFAPGTATFTIVLQANDEQFGINDQTITQNFNVNSDSNETDNSENSVNVSTAYVTPDADISVSATDSPDPVLPDGSITYTVTVSNTGPDTAPNVRLNVLLNNTLRFQSITVPVGFDCSSAPPPGGGTSFSCATPSMASGGSATFTIVLQANEEQFGNNSQTIVQNFTVNSGIFDPDNNDNTVSVSTQYAGTATAASVTIAGRVTTARGRGIRNAVVRLVDERGEIRTIVTSPFGYYRFTDVAVGRSYTIIVSAKRHIFAQPTQLLSLAGETEGIDFVAEN